MILYNIYHNVTYEKRHIKDYYGNEYDIWVFYRDKGGIFGKTQLCVCDTEEQFNLALEHFNLKK